MDKFNLPPGLYLRPATAGDTAFFEALYVSLRNDLNAIDASADMIAAVKRQQYQAQTTSYEQNYPNAMHFVIEYESGRVGRAIVDFGANEVRIVDISLSEKVRNKGLGTAVLQGFIASAAKISAPLSISVLETNIAAQRLYKKLGFTEEERAGGYIQMSIYAKRTVITV